MKDEMKCPFCGSTDDDVYVGATHLECKCEGLKPEFQERNVKYYLEKAQQEREEDEWFANWHGIDINILDGHGPTRTTAFEMLVKRTVDLLGPITNFPQALAKYKAGLEECEGTTMEEAEKAPVTSDHQHNLGQINSGTINLT